MSAKDNIQTSDKNTKGNAPKQNFLQSIFSSLFSSSNPEAAKKKKLKAIAKNISKSKYHAFYKASSEEMMQPFGKLMFDIYKVVNPAQLLFRNTQNQNAFKHQIINYALSDKQVDLLAQLDEQKIQEMSRQIEIKVLQQQVEEKLQLFSAEFDSNRINKIESIYKAFTLFKDFCCFDYYLLLKKYDSTIQEGVFTTAPKLDKVNAEYVIEDLKDFLSVAYSITDESIDWNGFFEMIKTTYGKEYVSLGVWKKIIAKVRSIQVSGTLDLIIQHVSQDPKYETVTRYHYESLVEPYLDKIQNGTREVLANIVSAQKDSKTNSICMQIFGKTDVQSLLYYTTGYNNVLEKKNLNLYEYAEPLNFLKSFLVEYVKKEIREYYEVVVIRGQWDSTLSAPMSNAYQELLSTSEKITEFDNMMSEEGAFGMKIKTLMPKTAHDSGAENIINRVVSDANDMAKTFIYTSTQNLITIGKTLKQLIEDYSKPKAVIVKNWKELDKFIESPMKDFSVGIYKKIYLFVQLMQEYLNNE